LHRFDTAHECDGRTDRQTDGRTPRRWQRRAKHSAFARKKEEKERVRIGQKKREGKKGRELSPPLAVR